MQKNEKLIRSLQNIHTELASFYESAHQILQSPDIKNKFQASAYCIRELLNRLPNQFDSSLIKSGKKISNKISPLIDVWKTLNIRNSLDISSEIQWESEQISDIKVFLNKFNEFVEIDQEIKETRREYAAQFIHKQNEKYSLEHLPDNHIDYLGKNFNDFMNYFNKVLHGPIVDINEEEFKQYLTKLEFYLIGIIDPNVKETYEKIDRIIEEERIPNINHVKSVMSLIHNKVSYDYFFNHLNSPSWLEPLTIEGIFKSPPDIIFHNEFIRIPIWAPSRYLVNTAKKAPEKTAKIILSIPENRNLRIYEDYVDAALQMPLAQAKTIIKKTIGFLDSPYSFNFSHKLCEFVVFLLKSQCPNKAFEICYRLFDIQDSGDSYDRYKHFFTNNWDYNEQLKLIYAELKTPEVKMQFFRFICIQLKNCIGYDGFNTNSFVDHSSSWRQEVHKSHNVDIDIKHTLINWLVKLSEELLLYCEKEVFSTLISQPFPIFVRIALYLLQDRLDSKSYIFELLQTEEYFSCLDVWHEYAVLLQKTFPGLEQENQEYFLDFIANIKTHKRKEQNELIKYRIYYLIKDYLKGKIKNDFELILQNHGDIQEPTFLIYFYSGSVNLEDLNPISIEEFNEKNFEERLQYILDWKPQEKHNPYENKSGLYNLLKNSIKSLSDEYITHIDLLKIEDEQFILAVIQGFESLLSDSDLPLCKPLIGYLNWAVEDRSLEKKNAKFRLTEIRMAVCRLLEKSFSSSNDKIHFSLRDDIWLIINNCLKDSDPSSDSKKPSRDDDSDFYHIAINSVRSRALECSIRYGLWCMRHLKITAGKGKTSICPELFQALEYHLDLNNEQSLAVHSIYGRWLPWLHLLDKQWTRQNLLKIFPKTKNKLKLRRSAWETYLLYVEPYDEIFNLIEKEYIYAVNQLPTDNTDKASIRLIDELIIFFLRGTIKSIESEIFNILYKKNNIKLLKEIICFTGRAAQEHSKDKAIAIWGKTLSKCDELGQFTPLSKFGQWASLDFIDDEWLLDQIIIVLNKAKYIHSEHHVTDRLFQACELHPKKVAEILNLVVSNKLIYQGFNMWRSGFDALIPALLNTEAKTETKEIINKLLLLGLGDFEIFCD